MNSLIGLADRLVEERPAGWWIVSGGPGTGKTAVLRSLARVVAGSLASGLVLFAEEPMDYSGDFWSEEGGSCPVAILDGLLPDREAAFLRALPARELGVAAVTASRPQILLYHLGSTTAQRHKVLFLKKADSGMVLAAAVDLSGHPMWQECIPLAELRECMALPWPECGLLRVETLHKFDGRRQRRYTVCLGAHEPPRAGAV